jgi:thiosulfate/3-mercaptopyruvate sulfurtransferase
MPFHLISPIIDIQELLSIHQSPEVLIFDASGSPKAREYYKSGHLKGAYFVDVNKQLSDIKADFKDGGRHPLPPVDTFAKTLSELGISPDSHVIIYDDAFGANAASRFWWMLKAVGHEKVQVLNGGLQSARKHGFPLETGINTPKSTPHPYPVTDWQFPTVDITEVERVVGLDAYVVVDVRSKERYDGLTEPIDLIAGHIPGAVNIPLSQNTDESGRFLSPVELNKNYSKHFAGIDRNNVIVHCGSGVSACQTILAMHHAGMPVPILYVGSWSEWSRNIKPIGKIINE